MGWEENISSSPGTKLPYIMTASLVDFQSPYIYADPTVARISDIQGFWRQGWLTLSHSPLPLQWWKPNTYHDAKVTTDCAFGSLILSSQFSLACWVTVFSLMNFSVLQQVLTSKGIYLLAILVRGIYVGTFLEPSWLSEFVVARTDTSQILSISRLKSILALDVSFELFIWVIPLPATSFFLFPFLKHVFKFSFLISTIC